MIEPRTDPPVRARRFELWALVALGASVFVFLVLHRGHVPMWVEGLGEYEGAIYTILGIEDAHPPCWMRVGDVDLPLAFASYVGPLYIYAYLPSVSLFASGLVADAYVYRVTGFFLFLLCAALFYLVLREWFHGFVPAVGTAAFLLAPTLLLTALTEYQSNYLPLALVLVAALFFARYLRSARVRDAAIASGAIGLTLLTRFEILVWLSAPFVIWFFVHRRSPAWREALRRLRSGRLIGSCLAAFTVAVSPVLAYNLTCEEGRLFDLLRGSVLPNALRGDVPLTAKLATRVSHFWDHALLQTWPRFELVVENYAFALLFLGAAAWLLLRAVREGRVSFSLLAILCIVPLSIVVTAGLRMEHLTILQPLALVVVLSALHGLSARRRDLAVLLAAILLASEAAASWADWRHWQRLPPTSETMLNQSDPALLSDYLSKHHASDRLLFTNVGLKQYAHYFSRGRLRGEDIFGWSGREEFVGLVRLALLDRGRRRVFVGVALDHDGASGSGARTLLLHQLLASYGMPYQPVILSSAANDGLYELIVLEPGTGPAALAVARDFVVERASDVRIQPGPDGRPLMIGSVLGSGFAPGDTVLVGGAVAPTTFGDSGWMTFAMPVPPQPPWTLRVVRPSSQEISGEVPVTLRP